MLVCRADPEAVRRRLAHRRGDASDADWAVYQGAARRWEEPSPRTLASARPIDTGGSLEESVAQALEILKEFELVGPTG
jgi:predicted kinase